MNGISKTPAAFALENPTWYKKERSVITGRNLKNTDSRKPPMMGNKAALEVVFC